MPDKIPGGYILLARKMLESAVMDKPPLYLKLWTWMLLQAKFKEDKKLQRGQFITSIHDMQEAMSHYVGYRKVTPTKRQIRSIYERFNEASMTVTTKVTGGLLITILKYEEYQDPKNYECHDEKTAKRSCMSHLNKEKERVRIHTVQNSPKNQIPEDYQTVPKATQAKWENFNQFWQAYPRKKAKKDAFRAWCQIPNAVNAKLNKIISAAKGVRNTPEYKNPERRKYIKLPATWLRAVCWEDEDTFEPELVRYIDGENPVSANRPDDWKAP